MKLREASVNPQSLVSCIMTANRRPDVPLMIVLSFGHLSP